MSAEALPLKFPYREGDHSVPDALGRESTVDRLLSLVQQVPTPYVIALSGPFGSGKSWILHRLSSRLEKDHEVIAISAWALDQHYDPCAHLLEKILTSAQGISKVEQKLEDVTPVTLRIRESFLKNLKTFLKSPGLKAMGGVVASKFGQDLPFEAALVVLNELIESPQPESPISPRITLPHVLIAIEGAVEELRSLGQGESEPRLIVIVDELERARPEFALRMLESIKHFFRIPGVIFVIGAERDQLLTSIGTVVGSGSDMEGFVRKYVDVSFEVDSAVSRELFSFRLASIIEEYLIGTDKGWSGPKVQPQVEQVIDDIATIAIALQFSMREFYRATDLIEILLRTNPKGRKLHPSIIGYLACCRTRGYERFKNALQTHENWQKQALSKHATLEVSEKTIERISVIMGAAVNGVENVNLFYPDTYGLVEKNVTNVIRGEIVSLGVHTKTDVRRCISSLFSLRQESY